MRVDVPLGMPELLGPRVVPVPQRRRDAARQPSRTSAIAASIAAITAFDFGAVARCTVTWASAIRASGRPTSATTWAAATAAGSAVGSASPTSSLACTMSRLATNRGSSPATSMRAR